MEKRVVQMWMLAGEDLPYWKSRTKAYLLSQGHAIWEIVDQEYAIPQDLNTASAGELVRYENNSKAINILLSALGMSEHDRVANLDTAHAIWDKLCTYHEGTNQVKSMRKDSYNRQYQTFAQKPGESLYAIFVGLRQLCATCGLVVPLCTMTMIELSNCCIHLMKMFGGLKLLL